jgi:hypothetical protein
VPAETFPSPTAIVTPTSKPYDGPAPIAWKELEGDRGLGKELSATNVVQANGIYVAIGSVGTQYGWDEYQALWRSGDGTDWQRIPFPHTDTVIDGGEFLVAATTLGETFVVVGWDNEDGVAYTSSNGRDWQSATTKFAGSPLNAVIKRGGTLVAAGDDGSVWTSTDGMEWKQTTSAANGPVRAQLMIEVDGSLVAFSYETSDADVAPPIVEWTSDDAASWTQVGEVPGSISAGDLSAALTPGGLILLSAPDSDWSSRRMLWIEAAPGQWHPLSAPKGALQLETTSFGFVALGHCLAPGEDSELWDPDSDASGITWLSADGVSWVPVEQTDAEAEVIHTVFERGSDLVGLGFDADHYYKNKLDGAVWVSPLPPTDESEWNTAPVGYADATCGDY